MIKVVTVTEFKYRQALADVLDDVHRKNITKTLQNAGAEVKTGDWAELERLAHRFENRLNDGDMLCNVEYMGEDPMAYGACVPFGPLFGETYTLVMSGPTDYYSAQPSGPLGGDKYKRYIKLYTPPFDSFPDTTVIYVLCNTPPVAVHYNAYMDIFDINRELIPDAEIIRLAQQKFGSNGVEFLSEDLARQVIHALRTDRSETYNIDFYFHGRRPEPRQKG